MSRKKNSLSAHNRLKFDAKILSRLKIRQQKFITRKIPRGSLKRRQMRAARGIYGMQRDLIESEETAIYGSRCRCVRLESHNLLCNVLKYFTSRSRERKKGLNT